MEINLNAYNTYIYICIKTLHTQKIHIIANAKKRWRTQFAFIQLGIGKVFMALQLLQLQMYYANPTINTLLTVIKINRRNENREQQILSCCNTFRKGKSGCIYKFWRGENRIKLQVVQFQNFSLYLILVTTFVA